MALSNIEKHYNKHPEDLRLQRRHGIVEFETTMHHLRRYIKPDSLLLDIGAGTGRYSVPLAFEGYDVTAVELVKHNLGRLKQKGAGVKAYQGNALKLSRFDDESFDLTLLFGPMYHLHSKRLLHEKLYKPYFTILFSF